MNFRDILQSFKFPVTEWQVGHNKVFLRGKIYEPLEEKRLAVFNIKATKIQAIWKGFRVRKSKKKLISQVRQVHLGKNIRQANKNINKKCTYSLDYTGRLRATLIIQAFYRTWKLRLKFLRKRRAAIVIQSHLRGMFAREVAVALREMRKVEEAMRKQEEYNNKRKSIIQQQSENGSSIEDGSLDSSQEAKEELDKLARELSEMQSAGGLGGKTSGFENLFSFLTEAKDNDAAAAAEIHRIISSTVNHKNETPSENDLETLGSQMDLLVANLEDELESQATTTTNNRGSHNLSSLESEYEDDMTEENDHIRRDNGNSSDIPPSPPALPPPGENMICPPPPPSTIILNKFGKYQPTLPEPKVPPPPIPPGAITGANNKTGGQVNLMKPTLTAAMAKQQAVARTRQNNQVNTSQETHPGKIVDVKAQVQRKTTTVRNGNEEPIYESIQPRHDISNGVQSTPTPPTSADAQLLNKHRDRDSIESTQSTKSWKFMGSTGQTQGHAVVNLTPKPLGTAADSGMSGPPQPPAAPPPPPLQQNMNNNNIPNGPNVTTKILQKPPLPQVPKFQSRTTPPITMNGNIHPQRNIVTRKLQELTTTQAHSGGAVPSPIAANVNQNQSNCNVPDNKNDHLVDEFPMLEFALQYFNDWENKGDFLLSKRSTTSTKENIVPKAEMICYTKSSTIPNSHLHLYDPSNISISITMFRDLQKYARAEFKPETELQFIQNLISYGLERDEIRDEVYVQITRLINQNESNEQIEKLYLLLCLGKYKFGFNNQKRLLT